MSDLVSRQYLLDEYDRQHQGPPGGARKIIEEAPAAQLEQPSEIQDILNYLDTVLHPIISPEHWDVYSELHDMISTLPSSEPKLDKKDTPKHGDSAKFGVKTGKTCADCISRRDAIDAVESTTWYHQGRNGEMLKGASSEEQAWYKAEDIYKVLNDLPSAQPEQRTCVNCGRTVNNGGWYADGGTRCPIEEHYALPKDGYCHLWEKRNVTDDDYPERRTDE